jgi:site-specific recombinase XerD
MIDTGTIPAYLDRLATRGASENTIRAYRTDLRQFAEWAGQELNPVEVSETLAATYLTTHRGEWSATTTNRKLIALRSWAKWAGEPTFLHDYMAPTPAAPQPHPLPEGIPGVMRMIGVVTMPKYPRDRMKSAARCHQRRALVALCGLCGLRVDEAVRTTAADIDVARSELKVRGKGDKTRVVPLSTKAWDAIRPAYNLAKLRGSTLTEVENRQARRIITYLGHKAGLSRDVSSHDLRATFATAAYEASKDIRAVQELLGHSSVETTQVYTGISKETRRAVVEAV